MKCEVHILLGVWGEDFIHDFMELSLPSLLAPGNIPALSKNYGTKFILLTRHSYTHFFETHLAFQKLKEFCEVEFIAIDDLIGMGNYSTTLTLAYDRAIKKTGDAMLNTYFIFLVSDYIMANGSFEGLMRYMSKGYSGICAGNFQVTKKNIVPQLLTLRDVEKQSLSINPRDLLRIGFRCMHTTSIASLYDQTLVHNYHANRFLYKDSETLLAGRFYLLHMLCIKPETTHYQIGSSCDYSYIPEMCPSGRVGIINDSDDYLVVEMQPKKQGLNVIDMGGYKINTLANALGQWTTSQHRENSKHTLYFHSEEMTDESKKRAASRLGSFIDLLNQKLKKYKVKSFKKHPYWLGAVRIYKGQLQAFKSVNSYTFVDFTFIQSSMRKFLNIVRGKCPNYYILHHRWYETKCIRNYLTQFIKNKDNKNIAVFYDEFEYDYMFYSAWMKKKLKINNHYYTPELMKALNESRNISILESDSFIFFTKLHTYTATKKMLDYLIKMNYKGKLLLVIPNSDLYFDFEQKFLSRMGYFSGLPFKMESIIPIHNSLSLLGHKFFHKINKYYFFNSKVRMLLHASIYLPGALFCTIINLIPFVFKNKGSYCTNILVTLDSRDN